MEAHFSIIKKLSRYEKILTLIVLIVGLAFSIYVWHEGKIRARIERQSVMLQKGHEAKYFIVKDLTRTQTLFDIVLEMPVPTHELTKLGPIPRPEWSIQITNQREYYISQMQENIAHLKEILNETNEILNRYGDFQEIASVQSIEANIIRFEQIFLMARSISECRLPV